MAPSTRANPSCVEGLCKFTFAVSKAREAVAACLHRAYNACALCLSPPSECWPSSIGRGGNATLAPAIGTTPSLKSKNKVFGTEKNYDILNVSLQSWPSTRCDVFAKG
mmetsp:Transcript_2752/g.8292  ORF Transcript_2752/g.8292 Transcript_2752/m.8292 type:complete len:108 (+) Transcript_2752:433-756(+)